MIETEARLSPEVQFVAWINNLRNRGLTLDEIIEAFNQAITATKKVDAETKAGKPLPGQPINK